MILEMGLLVRKMLERVKLDTPSTHVHDRSLSWFGTPNTHVHDRSLSWLDTPNTHVHDRSLSWLDTLTHIYMTTHFPDLIP